MERAGSNSRPCLFPPADLDPLRESVHPTRTYFANQSLQKSNIGLWLPDLMPFGKCPHSGLLFRLGQVIKVEKSSPLCYHQLSGVKETLVCLAHVLLIPCWFLSAHMPFTMYMTLYLPLGSNVGQKQPLSKLWWSVRSRVEDRQSQVK